LSDELPDFLSEELVLAAGVLLVDSEPVFVEPVLAESFWAESFCAEPFWSEPLDSDFAGAPLSEDDPDFA
jgi:hypothetical protein